MLQLGYYIKYVLNFLKINKNITLKILVYLITKKQNYKILISLSKNNSIDGIISRGDLGRYYQESATGKTY